MPGIRKNDTVVLIAGKDKGKKGRVLRIYPSTSRLLVEKLNLIKKHVRQKSQNVPGGIITAEAPMDISNVMLICKSCSRPTRIGRRILSGGTNGEKERFCKKCNEVIS